MKTSSLLKGYLFLVCLCLFAVSARAQEPQLLPPPVPDFYPPPPPDPDSLTPPDPIQGELSAPKDQGGDVVALEAPLAPAPEAEIPIAAPPPPIIEPLLPSLPDPADTEKAKPGLEIWRQESESPQAPPRVTDQLAPAYVTGDALVTLRVQFDPAAAGKTVYVRPGLGLNIGAAEAVLTISSAGDCILTAQLNQGFSRSHIIFYCEGVRTVLPVVRSSLQKVEEQEALTGGG